MSKLRPMRFDTERRANEYLGKHPEAYTPYSVLLEYRTGWTPYESYFIVAYRWGELEQVLCVDGKIRERDRKTGRIFEE